MVWNWHAVLLTLDIHCQQQIQLSVLKFCNSACVVPIGRALHSLNIDGITVKALTIQVKSLCSIKEGSVDGDSCLPFVHVVF